MFDRVIDIIESVLKTLAEIILGRSPRDMVDLITVDDDVTFISRGGQYMSVIEVYGSSTLVGQKEFTDTVIAATEVLKGRVSVGSGHHFKVFGDFNPDAIDAHLNELMGGARLQAKRMGLEVDDLIDEKISTNGQYCQVEKVFICFYTTIDAIPATSRKKALKDVGNNYKKGFVDDSQDIHGYSASLRSIHREVVKAIVRELSGKGVRCGLADTEKVLKNIVKTLQGETVGKNWEPDTLSWGAVEAARDQRRSVIYKSSKSKAVGEEYARYLRVADYKEKSLTPILPRTLAEQLVVDNATVVQRFVVIKDKIYAPVHTVVHAESPTDFDVLLRSLRGTPFSIAYTVSPGGLETGLADKVKFSLVSFFGWIDSSNKQIKKALDQMSNYEVDGGVNVKYSIVVTTTAPARLTMDSDGQESYDFTLIQSRVDAVLTALNDWGGMQAASTVPDPLEAVYSTIPGMVAGHVSKPTCMPLPNAICQMPFMRGNMVWKEGAMLLRTEDGAPMPYKQYSKQQDATITFIMGPPGGGKSSGINALNLAFLLEPSESDLLPMMRGIDFGGSGKGVVDIVRDGLPEDRKHEAQYIRPDNTRRYAQNVLGTQLGARQPLDTHMVFLINFLQVMTHSMKDYPSHEKLCQAVIKETYRRYTDENKNPTAKLYSPKMCRAVDDYFKKNASKVKIVPNKTTWWKITDYLFSKKEYLLAVKAQHYACPVYEDLIAVSTSENISSEYGELHRGIPVTTLFSRTLREGLDSFAWLRGPTQFDVSHSPIAVFDLQGMIPSGLDDRDESQRYRSGAIYMISMYTLTSDFFLSVEQVSQFKEPYAEYHHKRISNMKLLKSRFYVDEKHKVKGAIGVEQQLDQMIYQGRKENIDVLQGSQLFDSFSVATQKLANTIFFCGVGSEDEVIEMQEHYNLNDSQAAVLRSLQGVGPTGARMLALFKTNQEGAKFQGFEVVNTEGPLMLCSIATMQDDRYIRGRLYDLLPSQKIARSVYAKAFPSGKVKGRVEFLTKSMEQGIYKKQHENLLDDIVHELVMDYLEEVRKGPAA